MIRLCLETAARCLGVALMEGEAVRAEFLEERTQSQSALLFPALERLMKEAGLTLADVAEIAVSSGPGSFTGLRIGAATARALADARGIPLVPVPTLLGLALAAAREEDGLVVMSRVRGEAFVQPFEWRGGVPCAVGAMAVQKYEEMALLPGSILVCDADAADALEARSGGAQVQRVAPAARWAGVYAERAGGGGFARGFFPEYGPSPVYRKRGRPA